MKKLTHSIFAAIMFGMTLLPGPALAAKPDPPQVVQRRYYNCRLENEDDCLAEVYNDQLNGEDWCYDEIYDNGDVTYHGYCYD